MSSIASPDPMMPNQPAACPLADEKIAASSTPRVSVVIPTHNSAATLKEAIESVLAQTYSNLEINVIDDGSTDDTEEVVRQLGDRIRYFKQANKGVSAARNAGIRQARGEFIAFLDSDDLWLPEKLAQEIPALEADPKLGLVYCDWAVVSGDTVVQDSYLKDLPAASGYVFDELIQSGFILTSGVVVRRACLDDVGDFDNSLSIAQDYDLWLRISYRWKVRLVKQCLFTKRNMNGSLSSNLNKTALERIALFQKTLRNLPGMTPRSRRLVRRQLALSYWDVGYDRFDSFSFREARKNFRSSLQCDWTNLRALAYWTATYFPVSFVRAIKAVKQANS